MLMLLWLTTVLIIHQSAFSKSPIQKKMFYYSGKKPPEQRRSNQRWLLLSPECFLMMLLVLIFLAEMVRSPYQTEQWRQKPGQPMITKMLGLLVILHHWQLVYGWETPF